MATQVFTTETIALSDDKEVTIRPLPIARLRRFMAAWSAAEHLEDGDDGFDIFINCCGIALEHNFKGDFDALKATKEESDKGEFLSEEYRDYLGETLELDTIYKVMEVSGGIKLNDPKLLEAVLEAQNQAQLGKTST